MAASATTEPRRRSLEELMAEAERLRNRERGRTLGLAAVLLVVVAFTWNRTGFDLGALVRDAITVFDCYLRLGRVWQPHSVRGMYLLPSATASCRHRLRRALADRFAAASMMATTGMRGWKQVGGRGGLPP